MSVRRLLLLFLLVGNLLALPLPASAGPRTTAEFNRVTIADRRAHGLRPMTVSPTLTKLARAHSGAMARRAAPLRRPLRQPGPRRRQGLGAPDPERLHALSRPPAQHPVPQRHPVRGQHLDRRPGHLGTVNFKQSPG
jgi:hypothetical protein